MILESLDFLLPQSGTLNWTQRSKDETHGDASGSGRGPVNGLIQRTDVTTIKRSVRTARVDESRLQAAVLQYDPVALVEGASSAVAQLVRRRGQVVGHHLKTLCPAPTEPLKSAHQRREPLPEACLSIAPAE